MDYFELTVNMEPRDPWSDILVAELAELGFESFVETDQGIQAYAPIQIGDVSSILKETSTGKSDAYLILSSFTFPFSPGANR